MSFEDLEIGICAHQETTQNISIGHNNKMGRETSRKVHKKCDGSRQKRAQ